MKPEDIDIQAEATEVESTSTVDETAAKASATTEGETYPEVIVLTSATREDLFAQFEQLKAERPDNTLIAGAVARSKDTGEYSLRVDIY